MQRIWLHSFVPDALIPAYVVLTGRRQCCGARLLTRHFDECPKTLRRRGRMSTKAVLAESSVSQGSRRRSHYDVGTTHLPQ
jgi:hypothetical protein